MDVRPLLRQLNLRPSRGRGQSFLADESVLPTLLQAAELTTDDTVLEVGPGLGILTTALAQRVGRVVAVEVDSRLADHLARVLTIFPNVRLLRGDILTVSPDLLPAPPYKIVANIPYSITAALLRRFLENPHPPTLLALMVQQEVAERVTAPPGHWSLLTASVQFYATARIVARVPARAFYPVPKVDSAVLRLDVRTTPVVDVAPDRFFRTVAAGFSQRRKQLRNSLAIGLGVTPADAAALLRQAGLDERRRAETLNLEEWGRLAEVVT